MKYINENPQTRMWKEKAERAMNDYNTCVSLMSSMKCGNEALRKQLDKAEKELESLRMDVYIFNDLPWWRKMFYKFKV